MWMEWADLDAGKEFLHEEAASGRYQPLMPLGVILMYVVHTQD